MAEPLDLDNSRPALSKMQKVIRQRGLGAQQLEGQLAAQAEKVTAPQARKAGAKIMSSVGGWARRHWILAAAGVLVVSSYINRGVSSLFSSDLSSETSSTPEASPTGVYIAPKIAMQTPDPVNLTAQVGKMSLSKDRFLSRSHLAGEGSDKDKQASIAAIVNHQGQPTLLVDLSKFKGNFKAEFSSDARGAEPVDIKPAGNGVYQVKDPQLNGALRILRGDGTIAVNVKLDGDLAKPQRDKLYASLRAGQSFVSKNTP